MLTGAILVDPATSTCPSKCTCRKRDVKCYAMTDDDFPRSWPALTTYIYMHEMNLQTIPPNAFKGLEYLNTVEFKQSNLGSISSCAFKSIDSLENIIFDQSVIGLLESFAINNMSGPLTLEFKSSRITTISPMAISDLDQISALNIKDTTIFEMNTMSIASVSGTLLNVTRSTFKQVASKPTDIGQFASVVMKGNKFETFPCGIFESPNWLKEGKESFVGNAVKCDCGIAYIKTLKNAAMKTFYGSMLCLKDDKINPEFIVGQALANLNSCNTASTTGCESDPIVKLPFLHCPVLEFAQGSYVEKPHGHGTANDPDNSVRREHSVNFVLMFVAILMILIS